jgi:hypothetical protein
MPDGVQGVLPLSLFAEFLIRLDIPGKRLEFLLYPPGEAAEEGALKAFSSNHLLFVRGRVDETCEGYFLLDTGASYTAISRNTARQLKMAEGLAPRISLLSGTAALDAPLVAPAVRLGVGKTEFATGPVVAIDLSTASRHHGFEVAGLIGYPPLAHSVPTVSYRDSLVLIGRR